MVKIAVFCPRFWNEVESAWQARAQACRLHIRSLRGADVLDFDNLEYLILQFSKHGFQKVLIVQSSLYPQKFWDWAYQNRISVQDVTLPAQEKADPKQVLEDRRPLPVRRTLTAHRHTPGRRETLTDRFASH